MVRAKRIAKRVGFGLAGLIAGVAIALGLAYAYAQSPGGRAWIAERLARMLSEPGGIEVAIEGLTGRFPQAPRIAELRLRDPQGTWLSARDLELDWHPLALLAGTLRVSRLDIRQVGIERPPEGLPAAEDEPSGPGLTSLPVELRVERLSVIEVVLGEAVLGTPAVFEIEGVAKTENTEELSASLRVARTDDVPGRIEAKARYGLREQRLALDLQASEPAGGLIARAFEIAGLPAVDLQLAGDGPLDRWEGQLTIALAGLARLEAEIGLGLESDLEFHVKGRADSEGTFDELPWRLVSGRTTFGVDGRWRRPDTLLIDQAQLESAVVHVSLAGRLDTNPLALDAEATAQVKDRRLFASLVEGMELDGLNLTAAAKGALAAPALSLRGRAQRLLLPAVEAGELALTAETRGPLLQPDLRLKAEAVHLTTVWATAGRVTTELEFTPDAPLDRAPLSGHIVASGSAAPLQLAAASDWQPALGQRLALRFDGRADLGTGEIAADRLSVETETLQTTGSGRYALNTGSGRVELETAFLDLGNLPPAAFQTEMSGRARFATTLVVESFGAALDAGVSGELLDLELGQPVARSLLAGRTRFAADVTLRPAEGLSLRGLSVESGSVKLAGDARLGPDFRTLEASYAAEIGDLGNLGAALGQSLAGSARVEGRAEGRLDGLDLSGRLTVRQAALADQRLGELRLDYMARNLPRQPAGRLDATLSGPLGEFRAETRYLYDGSALELSGLSIEGERTEVRGTGRIPADGSPVSADISVEAEMLEPWLALADVAAGGRGRARLKLAPEGSRQAARLEAVIEDLAIGLEDGDILTVRELTASVESSDVLEARRGRIALEAKELALAELGLASLKTEAAGGLAGGTVSLSAAGEWLGELRLRAEAEVSIAPESLSVEVSRLDGMVLGETARLGKPLRISRRQAAWQVADLDLTHGPARLSGAARIGPDRLSVDLTASDVPALALAPLLAEQARSGRVDARVRIEGPPAALTGQLSLDASELRLAALEDGPDLELALTGDWQAGRLSVTGRLSGLAEQDAVLSAALPLKLDAATLKPSVPPKEALSGRLTWQGPVAPIWDLVPITGQTLAGSAKLGLELSGTLATPQLTGQLAIEKGEYEHLEFGTLLRELKLLIDLDGERATLTTFTARNGGSGSVSATGTVELLPERGFPTDLSAEFKTFHALRRDDLIASANGHLKLEGTVEAATLTGRFETDMVEIRIPDRLPAEIVDLKAVEEGADLPAAADRPASAEDRGFPLRLDLTAEMPRRVFLRGRGIESEWGGRLMVGGTAAQPDIQGKLEMIRGQVAVLGKTFKFAHGKVDFPGGDTVDPMLDMEAVHAGKDLSITVKVTGRASEPRFALGSNPDLPDDEIVSRLLFGKTTTQLGAVEAAQLASAVAELSGVSTGNGVLENLRKSLGVDVLRVETVGEGEAASTGIAAGKYVTKDIYLGVTQGTAAESGTVEVEVEVSPHIFIDTEVDQTGESNVGVKFKWDY